MVMVKVKARAAVALVLVLVMAGSACARADRPIVIGAVYPTGGGQGTGGVEEYDGVRLAAELANARGGVNGRPVRVELAAADAAEGVPDAIRSLRAKGADVIVGSYGSTLSAVAARVAQEEDVVFWETGAVGEVPGTAAASERFFRVAPTGATLGRDAALFVNDILLPKLGLDRDVRYAVAYVDDAYGRAVGHGAIEGIKSSGSRPAVFPYPARRTDYEKVASAIGRNRTDVLVVGAYLEDGIELRRALVRHGVKLVTGIGTSSSYCMPEFGERLGADAVGLFASDKPDAGSLQSSRLRPDAAEAFTWARRTYERRFDGLMSAAGLAGFAGAWALFRHVLPRAESMSPDDVAAAALRTKLPLGALPNGSGLDLSEPGTNARALSVIWEWTRPGYRTIVWPPAFAWEEIELITPR